MMTQTELEQRIRSGIPLAANMDFRILNLQEQRIRIAGGAAENRNVHQTAFAGSLYALCTLAAWGLVYSRLPDKAELVIAEGSIRYRQPVIGEIIAECRLEPDAIEGFLDRLRQRGKGRLKATATIASDTGNAVEFSALLFARLNS